MNGEDEELLLVDSDEEGGPGAWNAELAARRALAMQHDSLFGLDSQSQQLFPMHMPMQAGPSSSAPKVTLPANAVMPITAVID